MLHLVLLKKVFKTWEVIFAWFTIIIYIPFLDLVQEPLPAMALGPGLEERQAARATGELVPD